MRHSAGGGTARSADADPNAEGQAPEIAAAPAGASPSLASEAETAEYIADLLWQLQRLANAHGFVRLQYILIQGRDEAGGLAKAAGATPVAKEA